MMYVAVYEAKIKREQRKYKAHEESATTGGDSHGLYMNMNILSLFANISQGSHPRIIFANI